MPEGNSIISLGDLSKPATVLIEKVSNAIGVLYEPRRIVNRAEAEAKAEKIKCMASIELNEIQQRAIDRFVQQEAKKQENIEQITAQAAINIPPEAKTEDLEEDWIAHFFDRCEKVSDEQMQSLWSRLLASEATKPGSYSKRTVDFIATMDKSDADLFTKFCQFIWVIGDATPLIFDSSNEIYTKHGITFASLKHLDSIGLISFDSSGGYRRYKFPKNTIIFYYGLPTLLEFHKENDNQINVGKVLLTQAGRELVNICCSERNQEFYEYAIDNLSRQNIILSSALTNKK